MEVEDFSAQELSPEDIKQLEKFRRMIEASVSDGRISLAEQERLKKIIFANKKIIPAAIHLYSTLVLDKINRGELEYEWE
ncbi:hypothetical protein STA3757_28810 [Stanieria sp. NIES-3757]|nr:hypothetical protein STA3757_28810 [Stanieria sp. NIES-3757]